MTGLLLNLLLLAVIGFCVWQGYRKGLILSVAGVLIIFIAAFLAGKTAAANANSVSEKLLPIMSWVAEDAINDAERGRGPINQITDPEALADITEDVFRKMGISEREIKAMVGRVLPSLSDPGQTAKEAIEATSLYVAAYALIAIFSFILYAVGLTLLIYFVSAVFKLPVLNLIDKIGGAATGLLYGMLILSAVGWAMRYLGIFTSFDLVSSTAVLRFFSRFNLLSWLLSI
jgi:uncharacterized membrane protein required for colicin V production